ncbi:GMC oxidoreductase-domain-containing protein [Suillus ampliporus]|nr:GMC oxidoreductase-domain-containing protein [Suillus ampliporus]
MSQPFSPDIIFAGGGATACVAAGRLAACDPSLKILILEGGQHTLNKDSVVQPYQCPSHLAPTSTMMTFNIGNPSQNLNGRKPIVQCGRCVGGGSSVNFMMYNRSPASDFDDWGVHGWRSEDLIPLMKKLETYQAKPDSPTHGYSGPIKVSRGGRELTVCNEFIKVGITYHGRKFAEDTDDLETCNTYSPLLKYINETTGRRSDAASSYVYNQAHNTNLQVWVGKRVTRVIFADKRAVGVEFINDPISCPDADPSPSIVKASRLVVVAGGAFGSPAILERSGIGAKAVLERCGITQLVDLPGVGENYQDHNSAFATYFSADDIVTMDPLWSGDGSVVQGKHALAVFQIPLKHPNAEELAQWKIDSKSFIAQNGSDAKIKWRPDEEELKTMGPAFQPRWNEFFRDHPDRAVAIFIIFAGNSGEPILPILPRRNYFIACYFSLYAASIGSVHIKLENGRETIDFTPGYLNDPSDIVPLNVGYKRMREIFRRMPSYRGEVAARHPPFPQGSAAVCKEMTGPVELYAPDIIYSAEDDKVIDTFHRENVSTTWHSLGTCAMKPRVDNGVVDPRLNVYGVTNLKVADMSIVPKNVGTNTYSTALVIGEKAAMIIAEDLSLVCRL